ncbi:MAG: inositol monophosphatase [Gammaproteobacteria bacterium]|nr:inositol monophosphatase [Gammaproteobacteria bacterium]
MHETELQQRFTAAQSIARDAGRQALEYFARHGQLQVESKGVSDRVSEADRAVEDTIVSRLRALCPGDALLGEESGAKPGSLPDSPTWVIDPIDGTDCFVSGIPVWSISIALADAGEAALGVVYDPNAGELFAACRGAGATLNGFPIQANAADAFGDGLVSIGFSHRRSPAATLRTLQRLLDQGGMYQRNGSGALSLAYVAAGRYLGYYEAHINSWDALAGVALVREAGGWTSDFLASDGLYAGNEIIACGPNLVELMQRICSRGQST